MRKMKRDLSAGAGHQWPQDSASDVRERSDSQESHEETAPHPFRWLASQLGNTRHVCALFNSEDEEYLVLLPFIKDGFTCGDKGFTSSIRTSMKIICSAWQGSGSIRPPLSEPASSRFNEHGRYLREGRFDPDGWLQVFEQLASVTRTCVSASRSSANGLGSRGSTTLTGSLNSSPASTICGIVHDGAGGICTYQ